MEFSKKIVIATGVLFTIVVLTCLGIFVYCTICDIMYDWTGIVALLTVSGSVFGTNIAVYTNKAKYENVSKIKRSFLREKYEILQDIGVLDSVRAQAEIEEEINQIDSRLNMAEEESLTEVTYQQIM